MAARYRTAPRARHAAHRIALVLCAVIWPAATGPALTWADEDGTDATDASAQELLDRWQSEIQPLLAEHCVTCHGPAKQSGGLSLGTLTDLVAGGERGPVLDAAEPAASLLARVVTAESDPHMPPEEQLPPETVAAMSDWATKAAAVGADRLRELASSLGTPGPVDSAAALAYPAGVEPAVVIDLAIQARWKSLDQPDSSATAATSRCDDPTFIRRLYLDLVGRVPTFAERESFLGNSDSRKREQLIDQLLRTPEHARHYAELFDTMLMGRADARVMQQREKYGWLKFLTTAFTENRPWDRVAREILRARPESPDESGAAWFLYERKDQHQQIAEAISSGFFGVQIQCAQCHNHPLAEEIQQAHYWGLVAFFNRGKNVDTPQGPRIEESAIGGFAMFTNLEGESQPNRLVYLRTDAIDEPRPAEGEQQEDRDELYIDGTDGQPRIPRFSRREQFVDEVLRDHPLVARAMVNRLWALMMGRGLVHPVDQLDSVHPPSHPELLDWLADDFARSGYDVRRLLSHLARSRTYQQSSESDQFIDPAQFAVAATKPLSAETLYRSMLVALESDGVEERQSSDQLAEVRRAFPDVLPEESIASLRQALLLTNGADIHDLLTPEHSGLIARLHSMSSSEAIAEQAFLHVLGRSGDQEELRRAVDYLNARAKTAGRGIDQLVWSLLGSAEFRFNH